MVIVRKVCKRLQVLLNTAPLPVCKRLQYYFFNLSFAVQYDEYA